MKYGFVFRRLGTVLAGWIDRRLPRLEQFNGGGIVEGELQAQEIAKKRVRYALHFQVSVPDTFS